MAITNGKIIDRALFLASVAKAGLICAELSLDQFHEPISEGVIDAFESIDWQAKTIHNVTQSYKGPRNPSIIMGREMQRRGFTHRPSKVNCAASEPFVKPDGTIRQCACDGAPVIGRIGKFYEPIWVSACYRSREFRWAAVKRRVSRSERTSHQLRATG